VEDLTDRIEARVEDYLAKIDEMGGAVEAVRSGWMKGEIEAAAYEAQRQVESGDQVVVGVNRHRIEEEAEPEILKVDEEQVNQVLADLAALKAERDGKKADAALAALEISAAWGDADLPDLILRCVEAYCTIGEICRSLDTVLGGE
jgi:methylmalonyl-CoA mutase N-terminal domain/subunit